MKSFVKACVGFAAFSSVLVASAQVRSQAAPESIRASITPVKFGSSAPQLLAIENISTGEMYYPSEDDGVFTRSVAVFDSFTSVRPNGGANFSYVGPSPVFKTLCDLNDPNNPITFLYLDTLSDSRCVDPNDSGRASANFGFANNFNIRWDDYFTARAADPNQETQYTGMTVLINRRDLIGLNSVIGYVAGPGEFFDFDGDGLFENDGAVRFFLGWASGQGGTFFVNINTGPLNVNAYGAGVFLLDVDNFPYDPNTLTPIPGKVCGYSTTIAGGVVGDPNCETPAELIAVGTDLSAFFGDFWFWANAVNGSDANEPNFGLVDPNTDGLPGLSYTDILTDGLLFDVQYGAIDGASLAHAFNFVISDPNSNPSCTCPGDTDGDCDTDLTDLGILLGNFGGTGAGDVDGNGMVDLTDLGILLGDFGCVG